MWAQACANVTGSLEEQLEAVRAIKAELEASKEARQAAVAACASKLEAAGVVNNPHTRENVDTLLGRADELVKVGVHAHGQQQLWPLRHPWRVCVLCGCCALSSSTKRSKQCTTR